LGDVSVSRLEARDKIFAFEDELRKYPQVELPLVHRFSKGLYAREMFIPMGTIAVGKIHRYECLSIVSMGDITILTEHGAQRVQAPHTSVSPAGVKRVAYAHADTVLTTVHATDETDLERLEAELILKSYDSLPTQEEMLLLRGA
jgi:hypothetical protein